MKILHLERGAAGASRLAPAVLGLAARGHEVTWIGSPPARPHGGLTVLTRVPARWNADVVVATGTPLRPALVGAWCSARALVLDPAPVSWSALDHVAWSMLESVAMVPEITTSSASPWSAGRAVAWSGEGTGDGDPGHADVEILERACERLYARRLGFAHRPAALLDRDGTLVVEYGHLSDPDRIELLPGVPQALRELRATGHALVVVSNQAGVGRGLYPLESAHATMARLRELLRREGVEPDAIHFCPHAPDAGCTCRKPEGDLVRRAASDLRLDLRASIMIGDKRIDVETGRRLGTAAVMVRTGHGAEEERAGFAGSGPPDLIADDLVEATRWWLSRIPQGSSVSS